MRVTQQSEYVHCVKQNMPPHLSHMAKTINYKELDRLHENLYAQARRVLKKDVSDLPPRIFTEYLVDLSPKHIALYNQAVEDELIDMTTAQALYQATQQILLNPEKFGSEIKDNTLFETLDSIIDSLEGRKIIVYAWFNASVETICERYKHF